MSHRLLTLVVAGAALLVSMPATPRAAVNLNSSKSNCVKGGGTWVVERGGKSHCRLAASKGQAGGQAGLAVSDPGAPGDKPPKGKSK